MKARKESSVYHCSVPTAFTPGLCQQAAHAAFLEALNFGGSFPSLKCNIRPGVPDHQVIPVRSALQGQATLPRMHLVAVQGGRAEPNRRNVPANTPGEHTCPFPIKRITKIVGCGS